MPGSKLPGLFEAVGRGGQRITVWPAKDLVLVYTGGGFNTDDLSAFVLKSLKTEKPEQSLPPNPEANARLRSKLAAATLPPAAQPVPALPEIAAQISGKTFKLTANDLDLSTLSLAFDKPAQATLRLMWLGKELRCPVGLDGVERFSSDTIEELPFAAKGTWSSQNTFLLELDRVAGISLYRFELTFVEKGTSVTISLSERTGLAAQKFEGVARNE